MKGLTWCDAAWLTGKRDRYLCKVTGGACMFDFPDSEACAKVYRMGPKALRDTCKDGACTIRFPEDKNDHVKE